MTNETTVEPLERRISDCTDAAFAILYTSGSSGVPKGVRLTHTAMLNSLEWRWATFDPAAAFDPSGSLGADDVGLLKSSTSFIDGLLEMLEHLLQMHSLVILGSRSAIADVDTAIVDAIYRHGVSRVAFVPSHLQAFLRHVESDSALRGRLGASSRLQYVLSDGERLDRSVLDALWRLLPSVVVYNIYGATETCGDNTAMCLESCGDAMVDVPIGRPISNTFVGLVDARGRIVDVGNFGEVVVGGAQVCSYVDGDTIGKFEDAKDDLLKELSSGKWYHTGDHASMDEYGVVQLRGRREDLIKIRGQKLHLSEIDSAAAAVEGVLESCGVAMKPWGAVGDAQLVVFYTADDLDVQKRLDEAMRRTLPAFAAPRLVRLAQQGVKRLPRLASGKVDRGALQRIYDDLFARRADDEAALSSSSVLATLALVLGIREEALEPHKSFYENGGHSLNTLVAVERLREAGFDIGVADFLACDTLADVQRLGSAYTNGGGGRTSNERRYRIVPLDDGHLVERQAAASLATDSFLEYGAYEVYMEIPRAELYEQFYEEFYQVDMPLSFAIVDEQRRTEDGRPLLVAISMQYDGAREFKPVESNRVGDWLPVLEEIISGIEGPHLEKLPKRKGCVVITSGDSTLTTLPQSEKVRLMWIMQLHQLRLFYKLGYEYVLANNTSPVTQQVSGQLGYERVGTYCVAQLERSDGTRPFARKAPPDQIGTIDLLHVRDAVPSRLDDIERLLARELVEDHFVA